MTTDAMLKFWLFICIAGYTCFFMLALACAIKCAIEELRR